MAALIDSDPVLSCKTELLDENGTHSNSNDLPETVSQTIKLLSQNIDEDTYSANVSQSNPLCVKPEFVFVLNDLIAKTENVTEPASQRNSTNVKIEEYTVMEKISEPNSQYTSTSLQTQVWRLLEKSGFSSVATESTVSQIIEMLRNNVLQTEEQLCAVLGIKHPSLMTDNNNDYDEKDHEEFCIGIGVDESQDECVTRQTSDTEVKDKCHEVIEKYSTLPDSSNIGCQSDEYFKIHNDKRLQQCCVVLIKELKMPATTHPLNMSKPYKCQCCGKAFYESGDLKRHMRTHPVVKPICRKNSHFRTHPEEKRHKCPTCGNTFSRSHDLKRHIRIHTGEKPYKCQCCGKAFYESRHLKRHMRTHSLVKPICRKSSHFRTHPEEKRHKCPTCGNTFSRNHDLKRHIRIHTGEKPYKCTICGKMYSVKLYFERHIRRHTGEKPFESST